MEIMVEVDFLRQKRHHFGHSHHTPVSAQQGVERVLASLRQVMEQSKDRSHQETRHRSYQRSKQVSQGRPPLLPTLSCRSHRRDTAGIKVYEQVSSLYCGGRCEPSPPSSPIKLTIVALLLPTTSSTSQSGLPVSRRARERSPRT